MWITTHTQPSRSKHGQGGSSMCLPCPSASGTSPSARTHARVPHAPDGILPPATPMHSGMQRSESVSSAGVDGASRAHILLTRMLAQQTAVADDLPLAAAEHGPRMRKDMYACVCTHNSKNQTSAFTIVWAACQIATAAVLVLPRSNLGAWPVQRDLGWMIC